MGRGRDVYLQIFYYLVPLFSLAFPGVGLYVSLRFSGVMIDLFSEFFSSQSSRHFFFFVEENVILNLSSKEKKINPDFT